MDGSKVLALDGNAIPTGEFIDVTDTPYDFRTAQKISSRWNDTVDLCGQGWFSLVTEPQSFDRLVTQVVKATIQVGFTIRPNLLLPALLSGATSRESGAYGGI